MSQSKWQRLMRHLVTLPLHARKCFPPPVLERITAAIASSEQQHRGEIRFVVEHALAVSDVWHNVTARDRATDLFSELRIWDTEDNTGILIYVLLAEKAIEIVADRGINRQVSADYWRAICADLQAAFKRNDYDAGVTAAIATMTKTLQHHFPARGDNPNELPDAPLIR